MAIRLVVHTHTHKLNGSMNTWIFNAETHISTTRSGIVFGTIVNILLSHCCCYGIFFIHTCAQYMDFIFHSTVLKTVQRISSLYNDAEDLVYLRPTSRIRFISLLLVVAGCFCFLSVLNFISSETVWRARLFFRVFLFRVRNFFIRRNRDDFSK